MERLNDYNERLENLRNIMMEKHDKNALIIHAVRGSIIQEPFKDYIHKVMNKKKDCDFLIISLVRILYLGDSDSKEVAHARKEITDALCLFNFWPVQEDLKDDFKHLCFWSENHIFMTLGSCFLFKQWFYQKNVDNFDLLKKKLRKSLETQLLIRFLRAHCDERFNGLYEVNSHVYQPYTISALLNLIDFSLDEEIKIMSKYLLDRVVYVVMLSTTPNNGVSNLVASTRTFSRSRERNFNHNLNQLINLTNGVSPDPLQTTALSDFLVTTTWRPSESAYHALTHDGGLPNPLRLNHSTGLTRDIYYTARVPQEILGEKGDCMGEVREEEGLEGEKGFFEESLELELVPLYWSAGLVLHPQFTAATYNYQKVKKLESNETLRVLSFFSSSFLSGITHHFDHFSQGQLYTGVELNVFKKPMDGLLLTSFEGFNPHVAGFQQNPWMANIAGIPVWSQSGGGKEGLAGFSMTNTHNPNVTQKGSSACITYLTPKAIKDTLITRQLFSSAVRFFWPDLLFDQLISAPHKTAIKTQKPSIFRWFQASKPPQEPGFSEKTEPGFTWQVGRRDRCYIGVLCTKEYRVRVKRFKGKRGRGEPYLKIRGDEARRYLAMEEKKNYNTMNNDSKKGFNEDSVSDTTVEMVESGLIGNDKESDELRGFPDGLEGVDKKLISAHFENDPLEEDENAIISNDVEVQEKPLEVEVPVSYFQCSDHRQSWVVVVGVSNDFVDINEFLERRCRAISIQEMVQNGFYEIQIFDPREGNLSYIYNENTI